ANQMLLDGYPIFPNHLEKLLTAITVTQENNMTIHTFKISGFYSQAPTEDHPLQQLATKALQKVEKLQLIDSPAIMPFINQLSLLYLQFSITLSWQTISYLLPLLKNTYSST
ncbi:uncharacterized protein P174DRAFT_372900, partial [Aspergillus novofumigatus IBT 16806]